MNQPHVLARDRRVADDHLSAYGHCRQCGQAAERTTLSDYGGLCGRCFSDYCTGGRRNPPMPSLAQKTAALDRMRSVLKTTQHPPVWAQRLQQKRERGELLSYAQRTYLEAFERQGGNESLAAASDRLVESAQAGHDVPAEAMQAALRVSGDLPWPAEAGA